MKTDPKCDLNKINDYKSYYRYFHPKYQLYHFSQVDMIEKVSKSINIALVGDSVLCKNIFDSFGSLMVHRGVGDPSPFIYNGIDYYIKSLKIDIHTLTSALVKHKTHLIIFAIGEKDTPTTIMNLFSSLKTLKPKKAKIIFLLTDTVCNLEIYNIAKHANLAIIRVNRKLLTHQCEKSSKKILDAISEMIPSKKTKNFERRKWPCITM